MKREQGRMEYRVDESHGVGELESERVVGDLLGDFEWA